MQEQSTYFSDRAPPSKEQVQTKDLIDAAAQLNRDQFYAKSIGMPLHEVSLILESIVRNASESVDEEVEEESDNSDKPVPLYDIDDGVMHFMDCKSTIERNLTYYKTKISAFGNDQVTCGKYPKYSSLMNLARKNAYAAQKTGLQHLIYVFYAGMYLKEAREDNAKKFWKDLKGDPKRRSFQRYIKFYDDIRRYPMLLFLGSSLENVTKEAQRFDELVSASEKPGIEGATVKNLLVFFKKNIPKGIVVSFEKV